MKQENAVRDKSYALARRCVKLYKYLCEEKKEYILSKQLLRSGTTIGANIAESQYGQTKADFASKLSIAQKEAGKSEFWLRLLGDEEYITKTNDTNYKVGERLVINEKDAKEFTKLVEKVGSSILNIKLD